MIAALIQGALVADPVERISTNGRSFWTASVRVPAGDDALFIGLATFSETAGARLMNLAKGASIAAAGMMEQSTWADRHGNARTGWRLIVTEVLSVYQATKKRREAQE